MQRPPHAICPLGQLAMHIAFEHTRPVAHVRPQRPQFAGSERVSTQAPLHEASVLAHGPASPPPPSVAPPSGWLASSAPPSGAIIVPPSQPTTDAHTRPTTTVQPL
jgi:hypothetical protein